MENPSNDNIYHYQSAFRVSRNVISEQIDKGNCNFDCIKNIVRQKIENILKNNIVHRATEILSFDEQNLNAKYDVELYNKLINNINDIENIDELKHLITFLYMYINSRIQIEKPCRKCGYNVDVVQFMIYQLMNNFNMTNKFSIEQHIKNNYSNAFHILRDTKQIDYKTFIYYDLIKILDQELEITSSDIQKCKNKQEHYYCILHPPEYVKCEWEKDGVQTCCNEVPKFENANKTLCRYHRNLKSKNLKRKINYERKYHNLKPIR